MQRQAFTSTNTAYLSIKTLGTSFCGNSSKYNIFQENTLENVVCKLLFLNKQVTSKPKTIIIHHVTSRLAIRVDNVNSKSDGCFNLSVD